MNILHTVAGITKTSGGPSLCITSLCNHLAYAGQQVHLQTIGEKIRSDTWILPDAEVVKLHCVPSRRYFLAGLQRTPLFSKHIKNLHGQRQLDVIHDNGLWMSNNRASAMTASRLSIPLILSPHGMLEPWALKYHWWKKKPVWWHWQKATVAGAALLHATAPQEADNLRALGFNNPIAIIPNGVDLPLQVAAHQPAAQKTALFLSRVHPIKGITNLVDAWQQLRPQGWKLVIAGPDEGGHGAVIQQKILAAGLAGQIELVGPVEGAVKADLFANASVFVLPTFSENFGIVVAEALAAGVPVITTKGAPWAELEQHQCGWWVDIGVEPLVLALEQAIKLTDEDRRSMGQRGRALVAEKYSWEKIAQDMLSAYEWVLGGGTPPDCVRLD